ncbi:MAG: hypothetical protein V7752_21135 [Halopseudomonas sp.]
MYPVLESGVYATLDLGGSLRFGPNVEWVEAIDYSVSSNRASLFYKAIRRYWPSLPDDALVPDFAGVRPKLQGPGGSVQDFMI